MKFDIKTNLNMLNSIVVFTFYREYVFDKIDLKLSDSAKN